MRISVRSRSAQTPEPSQEDLWAVVVVAIVLAAFAGLADDWPAAISVFTAVLSLFAA